MTTQTQTQTQTQTPQPPLLLPSCSFHRRHRAASSSSSSSLSTASSATSSPSPSPRSTTNSVPFSWEDHPGIPKNFLPANPANLPTPLPLPPPLRAPPSLHHRRRRANPPPGHDADPFAAALAECTRERAVASGSGGNVIDTLFPTPASAPATGGRAGRRWSVAAGGVVGFLDLYGCKSAMAVAEGAFIVRPPVAVARPRPGRAGQGRSGRAGLP